MTFDNMNSQSLVTFVTQYQKQLNIVVVTLLSLYLLAFTAQVMWRIIPDPTLPAIPGATRSVTPFAPSARSGVNIPKIQALNLFGDAAAAPQIVETAPVTDAPETRLNLTLTGAVTSSEPSASTAIIAQSGTQNVYGIGEKIDGTNATLQQVFSDRVIIKNGLRNETLMLEGVDYSKPTARAPQTAIRPVAQPRDTSGPQLSQEARQAAASLRSNPASFADYISLSPKSDNGQMLGFEVSPGKSPVLFQSAGLKAGDIVSELNGLDLTDPQQVREALSELNNATNLDLTVIRDEDTIDISITLE